MPTVAAINDVSAVAAVAVVAPASAYVAAAAVDDAVAAAVTAAAVAAPTAVVVDYNTPLKSSSFCLFTSSVWDFGAETDIRDIPSSYNPK